MVDVLQPGGAASVAVVGTVSTDVIDRAGRLLGIVSAIQSGAWTFSLNAGGSIDLTDRAGRVVGVVTVSGEVEVSNDIGNPLSVLDASTTTRRWQDAVFEQLVRHTELLELLVMKLA